MGVIQPFNPKSNSSSTKFTVSFTRCELNSILKIYSQMVSQGYWRDYSISTFETKAVFSIFKRSSENPIYNIEKTPRKRKRNNLYSVTMIDGQIINNGVILEQVLSIFNRRLLKIV